MFSIRFEEKSECSAASPSPVACSPWRLILFTHVLYIGLSYGPRNSEALKAASGQE